MAQAIHSALARPKRPLVVGIMGSGHVVHGYGVPHQLRELGIADVTVLLPWDRGVECRELVAGIADAVFGVAAPVVPALRRQRLGIRIEPAAEGVRVAQVDKGSLAEAAGIREGDVIAEMAGLPVKQTSEVSETVQRQAPGTWLPLKVRRGDETVEIIAKFPPVAR
jgi:membrane-associated protease RseP (regulator of RpoE activity)